MLQLIKYLCQNRYKYVIFKPKITSLIERMVRIHFKKTNKLDLEEPWCRITSTQVVERELDKPDVACLSLVTNFPCA